jgi:hypothetical protein
VWRPQLGREVGVSSHTGGCGSCSGTGQARAGGRRHRQRCGRPYACPCQGFHAAIRHPCGSFSSRRAACSGHARGLCQLRSRGLTCWGSSLCLAESSWGSLGVTGVDREAGPAGVLQPRRACVSTQLLRVGCACNPFCGRSFCGLCIALALPSARRQQQGWPQPSRPAGCARTWVPL